MSSNLDPTSTAPRAFVPWWGRIDLLWLLFVPLCVTLYALLLPIGPNDFWYHARAGREIAASGAIPRINGFSSSPPWVTPQTPFHYQSWIAEWTLFRLLQSGGLSAVVIARAACLALTWSLIVAGAWRRAYAVAIENSARGNGAAIVDSTRVARLACGGALWSLLLSSNNMDTRPQMFSTPLFAAFVWAIFEWPHLSAPRRLQIGIVLVVLMALWANLHGAFFTALILLGLLLIGEIAGKLLARRTVWFARLFGASHWPQAAGIVLAGCVAGVCFNPRGAGIFDYVRNLATLQTGQRYIAEWQSPEFSLAEWNSLAFAISVACVLIIAIFATRRAHFALKVPQNGPKVPQSDLRYFEGEIGISGARAAEWLIALALIVMAMRDKRSILWFALFFAPLWSSAMASWRPPLRDQLPLPAPRATHYVNAILAIGLLLSIVPFLPRFKARLDWPPAFAARFAPTPRGEFPRGFSADPPLLLDASTPVEATNFLLHHPPRGRVWHDMVFGSYLMWALDERLQVMSDPRVELYPDAFWEDYASLCNGRPDAARVLHSRGFSDALLDPKLQAPLLRRLQSSPDWKIVFKSGPAVLLRRIYQNKLTTTKK